MPADYTIDPKLRLVRSVFSGSVTAAELLDHQNRLAADPALDPSFSQLFDATTVTDTDVDSDMVRRLAERHMFHAGARRAFVTEKTFAFGLARMFEIHRELAGGTETIRVFFEMNEALAWLGLPLATAPPL